MSGEVEPWIWRAAVRATKNYFRGVMSGVGITEQFSYRTGYIMGYRAGHRLGNKRRSKRA